jgi:antitoxin (DNA-binding transcriptional repressor) of toxin-antitoxin stability system
VARVLSGEEVIIAKSGKPIAKLVPVHAEKGSRKPGSAKGLIQMADDFNAPIDEATLADFES